MLFLISHTAVRLFTWWQSQSWFYLWWKSYFLWSDLITF